MLTLTFVAALAAAEASIIPAAEDSAIEEIIVTSRYRAEKLSDVPFFQGPICDDLAQAVTLILE